MKIRILSFNNKVLRVLWNIIFLLFFKPSPIFMFKWRASLLKCFGAKVGKNVRIYPRVKIWAPWNLKIGNFSSIANDVDFYNVDSISIGSYSTISQYSFLCTASHDYLNSVALTQAEMPLITAPIEIGDYVWIAAYVFLVPGIHIASGTVVLARSTVLKNTKEWSVVAGNPATFKKLRLLNNSLT